MEREVDDCLKDCQTLLSSKPLCHGWLRIPTKVHAVGEYIGSKITQVATITKSIADKFSWNKQYVILYNTFLFVFKEETSKSPEKIIRLCEYKSTCPCDLDSRSIPWPFKLLKKNDSSFQMFAATSNEDRSKWMGAIQREFENPTNEDNEYNALGENGDNADLDDEDFENSDSSDYLVYEEAHKAPRQNIPLPPLPSARNNVPLPAPEGTSPPLNRPPTLLPKNSFVSQTKNIIGSLLKTQNKKVPPNKTPPPVKPKPKLDNGSISSRIKTSSSVRQTSEEEYELFSTYEDTIHVTKTLSELSMWTGGADAATEEMTKHLKKDGVYLVRKATNGIGYTLAIITETVSKKFSIFEQNKKYSLLGEEFNDLESLLQHFTNHNLPNRQLRLQKPYSTA